MMQGILLFMISLEAIVVGNVQGVRYRVFVQDSATQLELVGNVKNMTDGSVQVIAEGPPDVLKEFVEFLHEGSLQARVDSVAVDWGTATGTFDEFSVLQ
jgi:acylphosphatase